MPKRSSYVFGDGVTRTMERIEKDMTSSQRKIKYVLRFPFTSFVIHRSVMTPTLVLFGWYY